MRRFQSNASSSPFHALFSNNGTPVESRSFTSTTRWRSPIRVKHHWELPMTKYPKPGAEPSATSWPNKRASPDDRTETEAPFAQARQAFSESLDEVGEQAMQAAETARDKAGELADRGKEAGIGQMQGFARAVRGAAEDLQEQSPEIARAARQAANGLDRAAASIRDRSIGEIADMFTDFARRQPAACFGGAVLAGFVMTRFMKSRSDRPRHMAGCSSSSGTSRPQSSNADARFPSPDNLPVSSSAIGELPS